MRFHGTSELKVVVECVCGGLVEGQFLNHGSRKAQAEINLHKSKKTEQS